jgi:hypothetical protein
VDVAPVGGCVAAGEDAVLVADLDGPAQAGWDDAFGAAVVQWRAVGPHDDPADVAVAGQPAGAGSGDLGPEAGARGAWAEGGVDQVGQRDGDGHVRLDGAQDRRRAGGEGDVGPLHEGVAELLGAGAQCAPRT